MLDDWHSQMTEEQQGKFIYGFDTFVQSSYITMLFVSVESAFRSFYSSTFSKEVPFDIYKVFKDLLCEFDLERYKDLLKLIITMVYIHQKTMRFPGETRQITLRRVKT